MIERCIEIGRITKTHKYSGEVKSVFSEDHIKDINIKEPVFLEINEKPVPFFIESFEIVDSDIAIIKFEDINSEEKALELVNCNLLVPTKKKNDQKDDFEGLKGYQVYDKKAGLIGRLNKIDDLPEQQMMQILHNNNEILVPVTEEIVLEINKDKKCIYIDLPDGLLDIYS